MANADDAQPKLVRWSWDWWKLAARRVGYTLSFLVVAGVAARVSYGHIRDVVLHVHQPVDVAHLLPLAVDGLMLIATLAMAEDKAQNRKPRGWARWGFWFGALISTAANVQAVMIVSGADPLAIAVGAAAPTLLLWSIEIVARPGKPRPVTAIAAVSAAVDAVIPAVAAEVPVTPEPAPVVVVEPETAPEPAPEVELEPVVVEEVRTRRRGARASVEAQERSERYAAKAVTREAVTDAIDAPVDAVLID